MEVSRQSRAKYTMLKWRGKACKSWIPLYLTQASSIWMASIAPTQRRGLKRSDGRAVRRARQRDMSMQRIMRDCRWSSSNRVVLSWDSKLMASPEMLSLEVHRVHTRMLTDWIQSRTMSSTVRVCCPQHSQWWCMTPWIRCPLTRWPWTPPLSNRKLGWLQSHLRESSRSHTNTQDCPHLTRRVRLEYLRDRDLLHSHLSIDTMWIHRT